MDTSNPSKRRKRSTNLAPEMLESRELLTGGAGDMFAVMPGTITQPGGTAVVKFTIDPTHFHLPKGKMALGIDVAADPTTSIQPLIASVNAPNGKVVPQTFHSIYDPHLPNSAATKSKTTTAVITPVHLNASNPKAPVTYSVVVRAASGTSGKFLLGFYLPGDVDGNGIVDQSDVAAVKASMNVSATNPKYNFNADANRDGRIGSIDLKYTMQNLGVSTDITPVAGATLDPAGMVDINQRVTRNPSAKFTGYLSPDAIVKFTETAGKVSPVVTTADSKGNYSITVPLAKGANTFHVTTLDAFGQSINGTLKAVTYDTNPAVTPASVSTLLAGTGTTTTATTKV